MTLKSWKIWLRRAFLAGLVAATLLILLITFSNWRIDEYGSEFVYDEIEQVPSNRVGLILGTSKKISSGLPNLYFRFRIEAAVKLYQAQKIDYILVSGDNSLKYYNEPLDMKKALIARGIPEEVIYLDYAGFRTLDSVVRCHKVFGQKRFTVISQEFHNKRAIYIGKSYGLDIVGYNAQDLSLRAGFKTQAREKLARVKVFLDLYLLGTQPKFLGKKIVIGKQAQR